MNYAFSKAIYNSSAVGGGAGIASPLPNALMVTSKQGAGEDGFEWDPKSIAGGSSNQQPHPRLSASSRGVFLEGRATLLRATRSRLLTLAWARRELRNWGICSPIRLYRSQQCATRIRIAATT